jgi:hypothetical protein
MALHPTTTAISPRALRVGFTVIGQSRPTEKLPPRLPSE